MCSTFTNVRSLRVRSSGLRLPTRKPTGNLKTMIELGPKLRRTAVMEASKPVRMALTPMMVPVPIITPSTVKKARSLWLRMVPSASLIPLLNASRFMGLSLDSQGLDGVQLGRAARRIDAEEQAHGGGKPDADEDGGHRQGHGYGSQVANGQGHQPRSGYSDEPAHAGQHRGFHQVLVEDVAPPGA